MDELSSLDTRLSLAVCELSSLAIYFFFEASDYTLTSSLFDRFELPLADDADDTEALFMPSLSCFTETGNDLLVSFF